MKESEKNHALTDEEVQTGLRNVLWDGLTTRAMITLTEGIFLVGFALKLGNDLNYTA